jgi:hypothetical protein
MIVPQNYVTSATPTAAMRAAVKKTLDEIIAAVRELQQPVEVADEQPSKPEKKPAPKKSTSKEKTDD